MKRDGEHVETPAQTLGSLLMKQKQGMLSVGTVRCQEWDETGIQAKRSIHWAEFAKIHRK